MVRKHQQRALEHYYCWAGMAIGLPLGVWIYQDGGWRLVAAMSAGLFVLATVVAWHWRAWEAAHD